MASSLPSSTSVIRKADRSAARRVHAHRLGTLPTGNLVAPDRGDKTDHEAETIHRSGKFMLFVQVEGLCQSVRLLAIHGDAPGSGTIKIASALREQLLKTVVGPAAEVVPQIRDNTSIAELLTIAEVMRATVAAFLSRDEFAEQQRAFGFARGTK